MTDLWDVRAVLLDMDGTLLDTERVYFDSLVGALNAFGYSDDVEALCHAMAGLPEPDCEAMLLARYGENFPLPAINRASVARRNATVAAGLALKRGALRATKRKGGNRIGFLTWHFTVQDDIAIQHLPCREQGEHADFDGVGNNYKIGRAHV